jgi:hypothetical protein
MDVILGAVMGKRITKFQWAAPFYLVAYRFPNPKRYTRL